MDSLGFFFNNILDHPVVTRSGLKHCDSAIEQQNNKYYKYLREKDRDPHTVGWGQNEK